MLSSFKVAWLQLSFHKVKLVVAASGVVVAVMLMLVQLGIRQGAIDNSVAIAKRISADLVLISPRTKTIFQSSSFPERLLYRAPAYDAVDRVQKVYISQGRLRNIWNYDEFPITIYGLDTWNPLMDFPGLKEHAQELELADHLLFDGLSRTTYGPILQYLETHENLETELNYRKVKIIDEIKVGISFNTDGNLYLSYANFFRLFPQRDAGNVDLGLVKLKPGYDPVEVRKALADFLGKEVQVKTYAELLNSEIAFLRENAPLDFIFGMGAAVGFFIGFVVVYQILYTEVVNHLPQFATMKAMGFDDWYLMKIVITQALLLSVLGYFPGFMLALWLYDVATTAIQMQFSMTWYRGIGVFLATVFMCSLSALIAIQKARTADPADVF